jgi:hypothetical protein
MAISIESLRGYILEEVIAYLIKNSGYNLLVNPDQDQRELVMLGNGLAVKGRGGLHQADVLGQLSWQPAFTFPVRLFIEAKFRNDKVGIDAVRNAVGILLDLNQNTSSFDEHESYFQRYHYSYALFSTSGFTIDAVDMAIAHQISLIDFSGIDFLELKNIISKTAAKINRHMGKAKGYYIESKIHKIRQAIRNKLETVTNPPRINNYHPNLNEHLNELKQESLRLGEWFLGMCNSPYVLFMKAENHHAFTRYLHNHKRHKIIITWNNQVDDGKTWEICPANYEDRNIYRLSFKLPQKLAKWIFGTKRDVTTRALDIKQQIFKYITIHRFENGQDQLFQLEFDANATIEHIHRRDV